MKLLSERLRSGDPLIDQEREFLANLLLHKVKLSPARLAAVEKRDEHLRIGEFVFVRLYTHGGSLEDAVAEAESEFRRCRRTVQAGWKALKAHPARVRYLAKLAKALGPAEPPVAQALHQLLALTYGEESATSRPVATGGHDEMAYRAMDEQEVRARFDSLSDKAFVRLPVVAQLYATSPSNVWRWVKKGVIPTPLKLGPQTTVWNVGDLRSALEQAKAAAFLRNGSPPAGSAT